MNTEQVLYALTPLPDGGEVLVRGGRYGKPGFDARWVAAAIERNARSDISIPL